MQLKKKGNKMRVILRKAAVAKTVTVSVYFA